MSRPTPADRLRRPKRTEVGVAIIRTEGSVISCSCGWYRHHARQKVREDAAEAHTNKSHGGQAMWF